MLWGGRLSGTQSCDQCASFGINSNCLPDLLPELTKLHWWIIVLKRSSPAQSLSGVFSYFIFFPAWQFSHLYSVQSVKIFCTANTACDVTVILSRFLFSSEVVSHIAFGDVSHLHSWVYCLVSSERGGGENVSVRQLFDSGPYFLGSICGNPVMFIPPQHHEHSGKSWCFAKKKNKKCFATLLS